MTRLRCHLLGCVCDSDPGCHRCGAGLYDADFVQFGRLDFVFRAYYRALRFVRRFTGRRCDVCDRWYWPLRQGFPDEWTCSRECADEWLPF